VPCCLSGAVAVVSKMQGDADGDILSRPGFSKNVRYKRYRARIACGLRRATCILGVGYVRRFLGRSDRAGCEIWQGRADTSLQISDYDMLLFLTMTSSYRYIGTILRSTGRLRDAR
jgi:hypothetical protein